MARKQINVSATHFHRLVQEFGTSRQTIYNALRYITDSDLAKEIRTSAKKILKEESESVSIDID